MKVFDRILKKLFPHTHDHCYWCRENYPLGTFEGDCCPKCLEGFLQTARNYDERKKRERIEELKEALQSPEIKRWICSIRADVAPTFPENETRND